MQSDLVAQYARQLGHKSFLHICLIFSS